MEWEGTIAEYVLNDHNERKGRAREKGGAPEEDEIEKTEEEEEQK